MLEYRIELVRPFKGRAVATFIKRHPPGAGHHMGNFGTALPRNDLIVLPVDDQRWHHQLSQHNRTFQRGLIGFYHVQIVRSDAQRKSTALQRAGPPGHASTRSFLLVYLGLIGADEHLFRVVAAAGDDEARLLASHFGLTTREGEILTWVVQGKSNRDIGEILGVSPRTVNKHLEQVFAKLGVENRALTAVRATNKLNASLSA